MPLWKPYLFVCLLTCFGFVGTAAGQSATCTFLGQEINFPNSVSRIQPLALAQPYSAETEIQVIQHFETLGYADLAQPLIQFRQAHIYDDWIFYQLIRKVANQFAPKAADYAGYTWLKWYLLRTTGYEAAMRANQQTLLLYIQSNETVYGIPCFVRNRRQYVCLNFHDYPGLNLELTPMNWETHQSAEVTRSFSYAVQQIPELPANSYESREVVFPSGKDEFRFELKVNPIVRQIFQNYPATDYARHFNMPLSTGTYASLIPALREQVAHLSREKGLMHLLHFTRYAFLFRPDTDQFGQEKRLSPEQTLLYSESDCEDRAGLFYLLVKEIYQLPMIVVGYPNHVTIAVQLGSAKGDVIHYNGQAYTICEPTPQRKDLKVGQLLPTLRDQPYEVLLTYQPSAPH